MSATYTIDASGITVPRAADVRASLLTAMSITNPQPGDAVLEIVDAVAVEIGVAWQGIAAIADASDPTTAEGYWLDQLVARSGVPPRQTATYSVLTATLTGTAGQLIGDGLVLQGGGPDGLALWRLASSVSIGGGGTVSGTFRAEAAGDIRADAAEVTTIYTATAGLTAASNPAAATPGAELEADAALRARWLASLSRPGAHSAAALRADILSVAGVIGCRVIDNPTASSVTVGSLPLPPGAVAVVVYPELGADAEDALALLLYEQLVSRGGMVGGESAVVTGADGWPHTVRWSYAAEQPVAVAVAVTPATGYEIADLDAAITEAVTAAIGTLAVGATLYPLALSAAIAAVPGVSDATFTLDAAPAAPITPDPDGILRAGTITVA